MRLSAKPIINYCNINSFSYGANWTIRAGEPNTLYFQLVDLDQASLRYMAGIGVSNQPFSVSVIFPSIDDSLIITVVATQADPSDQSIWKAALSSSQEPGSGTVKFAITEGATTRRFNVTGALAVEQINNGGC